MSNYWCKLTGGGGGHLLIGFLLLFFIYLFLVVVSSRLGSEHLVVSEEHDI